MAGEMVPASPGSGGHHPSLASACNALPAAVAGAAVPGGQHPVVSGNLCLEFYKGLSRRRPCNTLGIS